MPPPKPKHNTLRGMGSLPSSPPGDTPPPTPPLKPKKPTRLANRPLSSPDLNKLTMRGPKAEDFKMLFASLGSGDFDILICLALSPLSYLPTYIPLLIIDVWIHATFGKSYDWATKPVDPASLIWVDVR